MRKLLNFINKNKTLILVIASYVFFTVFYMGPSVWKCKDTLSGIGDNTGGPIWRADIKPEQPLLGGFQDNTNYPYGESLYSPVGMASITQTVMMKVASKFVGPVCSYNLINITGYLSTSILMYLFISYLLKNKWVAWLAGYAVAFTPYAQSKVGGHPSYGYASLLIAVFWLALHVMKTKKWQYSVGLSLVMAFCSYFDPYFILFVGTMLMPTLLVWVLMSYKSYKLNKSIKPELIGTIRSLIIAFLGLLILITPLIYVRVKDAKIIASTTGAVRGNIELAAMQCSNFPHDYLLPDPYNNNLVKIFGNTYTSKNIDIRHWCGPGESRVSISLVVISITMLGISILVWDKLNNRKIKLKRLISYDHVLVVWSVVGVAVTAMLIGLPPRINGMLMPSGIIIMLTDMWRIFAREYFVLNMMLIILFSIVLVYIHNSLKGKYSNITKILFAVITTIIMLEYQIHDSFRPFTFSFSRDVPQVYKILKEDPNITAIAEYPLDRLGVEADSIVYYTTMQIVHGKKLLNSAVPSGSSEKIHISIKDLSDPQTIPILRSLGISEIVVHGLTSDQILDKTNELEVIKEETPLVYGLTIIRSAPTNTMVLARIKDGPKLDYATVIEKGFVVNQEIMKSSVDQEYETIPDSEIGVQLLHESLPAKDSVPVCFEVKMSATGDNSPVQISVNGEIKQTINLNDTYTMVTVTLKPGDKILVHNEKMHNLRINNLGCKSI